MTSSSTATSRRGFLGVVAAGLAALPFVGGMVVALRAGLAPSGTTRPPRLPLCRLRDVPVDDVVAWPVTYTMRRGPAVEDVSRLVFLTRDPEDPTKAIAMSGECTHLGCPVQKQRAAPAVVQASGDSAAPLRCPCHGGAFSRTGEVVAGPPPRPLRRLVIEHPQNDDEPLILLEGQPG